MFKTLLIFIFFITACSGHSQRKETPREFINNVLVDSNLYSKDRNDILADLRLKMENHQASFSNPEYFDSTILIIDTILYDSSMNKVAVIVVAKNPTYRNPYSLSKLPYYYNANCYLGKRTQTEKSVFELKELGPFSLINFEDQATIEKAMGEYFFLELATVLDENSQPVFRYNLNDKRFWQSPTGWRRMFE